MNTDQLNKWLTLAANLGVIAGIIFLAMEINQSNRVAIAANDIALRQSFATLNESIYGNRELMELLVKARETDAEFSNVEWEILLTYVARQFNTWGSYERAYLAGLTSEDAMEGTLDDVRRMVQGFPGLRNAYRDQVEAYPGYSDSIVYRTVDEFGRRSLR